MSRANHDLIQLLDKLGMVFSPFYANIFSAAPGWFCRDPSVLFQNERHRHPQGKVRFRAYIMVSLNPPSLCERGGFQFPGLTGSPRGLDKLDKHKPTYTDWMKHRVDSTKGKQISSHRISVVEPVFANIGTNKKLHRFSLRSKTRVQGQWRLYCLVHNIEKLAKYSDMAA